MKLKTFSGGLHPADCKWSAARPIETCPLPSELVIPLAQHIGAPAEPCVAKGEWVKKGQVVGQAKGFVSVPVHATTSGEVLAVEARPHPSGRPLPAVVIRPDGEDAWLEELAGADGADLSADQIRQRIRAAGVVGLGGATFPAHVKLTPPEDKPIDTLILNGVECEPYLTADHRLMLEEPGRIVEGLTLLRQVLGVQRVLIGIEANKPDAVQVMRAAAAGLADVVPLQVKYPQGAEKQLILALTGREVPSGGLPMEVGVVVHNVGTAAAVSDAVLRGLPLIERITTVTGPGIATPKNLRVRIGTPLAHLLDFCGGLTGEPGKIIMGGPMMGQAQLSLEVPVIRGTSGVLLFRPSDLALPGAEGPCIRCGRCVQACPARLMPTTIAAFTRLDLLEEAEAFGAMDCIECGCCSYICPSAIPLVQTIRLAKGAILAKRRKL